jgi:hypothetical protein
MDERHVARLEDQLATAHSTNVGLRDRLEAAEKAQATANARVAEANHAISQLEKAHAKQRAAEDHSAAARRAQEEAARKLRRVEAELDDLRKDFEVVKSDSDAWAALNERVAKARHTDDLLGG